MTPTTRSCSARSAPARRPGPRPGFPLGVDQLGRDELSRLLYGARQSLLVGVVSTVLGLIVGLIARRAWPGAFGGRVDNVVMRFIDMLLSIPGLLIAITISVILGQSLHLGDDRDRDRQRPDLRPAAARLDAGPARRATTCWPPSRSALRRRKIVLSHVLPNSLGPVIVQATLTLATAIIDAAALSFLGLGNPDDSRPEWGAMLADAQNLLSHPRRRSRSTPASRSSWPRSASRCSASRCARPSTRSSGGDREWRCCEVEPTWLSTFTRRGRRDVHGRRRRVASPSTPARRSAWSASPGSRQVGHLAGDHGAAAAASGVRVGGSVAFDGRSLLTLRAGRPARHARPGHRDDLPGPAVLAEPGRPDRHPGHRGAGPAPGAVRRGRPPGGRPAARPGRASRTRSGG